MGVYQWDISALALPPTGGSPRPVLAEPTFNETYPALSPDGRWLAYASDEPGSYEVYVRSYPSLESKQQISRNGGVKPVWSRNGYELYYLVPDRANKSKKS